MPNVLWNSPEATRAFVDAYVRIFVDGYKPRVKRLTAMFRRYERAYARLQSPDPVPHTEKQ